jgi:heme-degrading monooxygenase HmoA
MGCPTNVPPVLGQRRSLARAVQRAVGSVSVSVVKINAITVPRERFEEFERRFSARAGKVEQAAGFEGFELLRPNDDREVCLVVTRWRSEDDFQAWVSSPDFAAGHSQHRQAGPVGTSSQLWSFDVLERYDG